VIASLRARRAIAVILAAGVSTALIVLIVFFALIE
jgi:hypothetical protein